MFKVNNKDTKTTSMTCSSFSIVDFGHVNVGWVMSIFSINQLVHKSLSTQVQFIANLTFHVN